MGMEFKYINIFQSDKLLLSSTVHIHFLLYKYMFKYCVFNFPKLLILLNVNLVQLAIQHRICMS